MGNGCSCSQSVKVSPQNPPFPTPVSDNNGSNGRAADIGALLKSTLGPSTSPAPNGGGSLLTSRRNNGGSEQQGSTPNPPAGQARLSKPGLVPPSSGSPQEAQLHSRLSAQLGGRPPPPPSSPPSRQDSGDPPPPLQLRGVGDGSAPPGISGMKGSRGLVPLLHKPVLPGVNSSSSSSGNSSSSSSNSNSSSNNGDGPAVVNPSVSQARVSTSATNNDNSSNYATQAANAAASADDGTTPALPWAVGTIVELKGLKSDAFNGLGGEVLQLDHTALRYVCRISSGHVTKIKPENLLKLEGAAAQHVKEEMKANEKGNVPMRAARRSSYDFVVDHCLLEKEAVLANTRKNAETKVEGAIPKVDQDVPATPKMRKLTFNDGILEDNVFGPGLRNVQEFDQGTPIKFMMGDDSDDGSGGASGSEAGDLPDRVSSPDSERPGSAGSSGDPYDFSYLTNA